MKKSIFQHFPDAYVAGFPIADGGEGTVDAFLQAASGQRVCVEVEGPYRELMKREYGIIESGRTAVIEMAACAGLPLVGENKQPEKASTYGVGQLMKDAIQKGCKKIILGLGGSASNDMGVGAAAALGVRFFNHAGEPFVPAGGKLSEIQHIDLSASLQAYSGVEIFAMCDIDNPLYGHNGAAYVFAPQKGAGAGLIKELDKQLRIGAKTIQSELGIDISDLPKRCLWRVFL